MERSSNILEMEYYQHTTALLIYIIHYIYIFFFLATL